MLRVVLALAVASLGADCVRTGFTRDPSTNAGSRGTPCFRWNFGQHHAPTRDTYALIAANVLPNNPGRRTPHRPPPPAFPIRRRGQQLVAREGTCDLTRPTYSFGTTEWVTVEGVTRGLRIDPGRNPSVLD